ncbi:MAG: hypothetical protein PVF45_09190 [Anaerolineae bacterium]|jgi:hypothetical protein
MSEENIAVETPEEETKEEAPQPDIANELQEFGHQLAAATKAVLASPEAQEAKVQLQRGLDSLSKTVNQLADQARETKVGQKVESGVSEASATLKEKRVLETLADSVAGALQAVNKAMGQAVEKAEKRTEAKAVKKGPQQIEVVETDMEEEEEVQA